MLRAWIESFFDYRPATYLFVCLVTLLYSVSGSLLFTESAAAQSRRGVAVPREIVQEMLRDEDLSKAALEKKNEYTVEGLSKYLVAEQIDLNRDGTPEIMVRGINDICGPYWCTHRIYRRTRGGYQLLLDEDVQDLKPQRTFTNGYRDVLTYRHGSAFDSELTLYKFDGKGYRARECFERHYNNWEDGRGRLHVSKRPTVKRVKCEPEE